MGSITGGLLQIAGGLTSLAGTITRSPALLAYGGKLTLAGNAVLAPIIAYHAWNDITSRDPSRAVTGAVDMASIAQPELGLLSIYMKVFAPPAAEAAAKVFSSATPRDMGEITGYSGATWFP